jgi:hypothetical protein
VSFSWFGSQRFQEIQNENRNRMERAVRLVRNFAVRSISHKTGRYGPGSPPGSPPYLRTGLLRRSVTTEVVDESGKIIGRVGTAVIYAGYLERGTSRMAARPWLVVAQQNTASQVAAIFSERMN